MSLVDRLPASQATVALPALEELKGITGVRPFRRLTLKQAANLPTSIVGGGFSHA